MDPRFELIDANRPPYCARWWMCPAWALHGKPRGDKLPTLTIASAGLRDATRQRVGSLIQIFYYNILLHLL